MDEELRTFLALKYGEFMVSRCHHVVDHKSFISIGFCKEGGLYVSFPLVSDKQPFIIKHEYFKEYELLFIVLSELYTMDDETNKFVIENFTATSYDLIRDFLP
jgi:hypothetical protein